MGPFELSERGVRGGTWWHGGRKAVLGIAVGRANYCKPRGGLLRPDTLAW